MHDGFAMSRVVMTEISRNLNQSRKDDPPRVQLMFVRCWWGWAGKLRPCTLQCNYCIPLTHCSSAPHCPARLHLLSTYCPPPPSHPSPIIRCQRQSVRVLPINDKLVKHLFQNVRSILLTVVSIVGPIIYYCLIYKARKILCWKEKENFMGDAE